MVVSNAAKKGFARAFDLAGNYREWPNIKSPRKKDYIALKGDWKKVGGDIERAEQRFEREFAGRIS